MQPTLLLQKSLLASAALCVLCAIGTLNAQTYPLKPIRIMTGGAGSNGDFTSRLMAPGLSTALGQQVIVENRQSGVILGDTVAKAAPDGYTLLITGSSFWLAPNLQSGIQWDPAKDFAPVSLAVSSPNLIVVHPSLPTKTVKDLIALATSRPGQLNYGSGATGSTPHLSAELFKSMARVDIVRINYKGVGQALNDLIAGHMQVMFPNAGGAAAHVKSGRIRALAVASAKPSALFPGVPTAAASGLPGYEAEVQNGVFVPARTPAAVISRLHQEITMTLSKPDIREKLFNSGVETHAAPPERLAAVVKNEIAVWGKLIRDLGIRDE